jgi:hypothetical protein
MTVAALVAAVLVRAIPGWRKLARRSWCAKQRSRLAEVQPRVLWVHDGEKMPWALWGAENGFFEVEWAHRLPYLRLVAAEK